MKITIRQPLCFTAQGRKDCQEDSLYPGLGEARTTDKYFLVCDGVGGSDHGEVASNTVTRTIGNFLNSRELPDGLLTEQIFNLALGQAYDALDGVYAGYSDSFKKMATTLTFLGIHRGGCLIAHIGDSRVYHIRPGVGILSRTNDHSLVNDLLKAGELTPEQAKTFKQKNVITRAMQPLMERRDRAEFTPVLQVEAGDYFFLCCDGVLEHLEEEKLVEILGRSGADDAEKLAAIKKICDDGNTRDNYTCYLVPIDTVESEPDFDAALATDEVEAAVTPEPVGGMVEEETVLHARPAERVVSRSGDCAPTVSVAPAGRRHPGTGTPVPAPKKGSSISMKTIAIVLFLLLVACVAFIVKSNLKSDKEKVGLEPVSVPSSEGGGKYRAPRGTKNDGHVIREIRTENKQPDARGAGTLTGRNANQNMPNGVSLSGNKKPEGQTDQDDNSGKQDGDDGESNPQDKYRGSNGDSTTRTKKFI